jgi:hypothetical protein
MSESRAFLAKLFRPLLPLFSVRILVATSRLCVFASLRYILHPTAPASSPPFSLCSPVRVAPNRERRAGTALPYHAARSWFVNPASGRAAPGDGRPTTVQVPGCWRSLPLRLRLCWLHYLKSRGGVCRVFRSHVESKKEAVFTAKRGLLPTFPDILTWQRASSAKAAGGQGREQRDRRPRHEGLRGTFLELQPPLLFVVSFGEQLR